MQIMQIWYVAYLTTEKGLCFSFILVQILVIYD